MSKSLDTRLIITPGDDRFRNKTTEEKLIDINEGFILLAETSKNAIIELRRELALLKRRVKRLEDEKKPIGQLRAERDFVMSTKKRRKR